MILNDLLKSVSNNTQKKKQIETLNFQTDMYVLLPTQFRCVSSCCPSSVAVEPSGKQRSKSWDCQKKRLRDCSRSVFFKVLEAIVERNLFVLCKFFVFKLFFSSNPPIHLRYPPQNGESSPTFYSFQINLHKLQLVFLFFFLKKIRSFWFCFLS